MMQWQEEAVASLAGELIDTGLATLNRYSYLSLNAALCPYLRGRMDPSELESLTSRWVQAMRRYVEYLYGQQSEAIEVASTLTTAGVTEPLRASRPRSTRGRCSGDDRFSHLALYLGTRAR